MDLAIYNLLSAQISRSNELNTTAHNITNSTTPGFKSNETLFKQFLTKDVNDINAMSYDAVNIINYKPGAYKFTEMPLDIALQGAGFFVISTPNGSRYTKNGNFTKSNNGVLVTQEGNTVLSDSGDQITFNNTDKDIKIARDGTVYVTDDTFTTVNRGKIGVVQFEDLTLLTQAEGSMLTSNVEPYPVEAQNYNILQYHLEESNVEPIREMQNLVELQRMHQLSMMLINDLYSQSNRVDKAISKQY